MKKILSILLVLAMSFLMVGALAEGESIEVAVTYTGEQLEVFQSLIAKFEEETGIKVNLDLYGDDYESTLKTRMFNNDLPDVLARPNESSDALFKFQNGVWQEEFLEIVAAALANRF